MYKSAENKENLKPLIQVLKQTADKFNSLKDEAQAFLDNENADKYMELLKQRTQLIIDLPNQIGNTLDNIDDPELKKKIEDDIRDYADIAQKRMEQGGSFAMGTLLVDMGSRMDDKNNLEKLIEYLESK